MDNISTTTKTKRTCKNFNIPTYHFYFLAGSFLSKREDFDSSNANSICLLISLLCAVEICLQMGRPCLTSCNSSRDELDNSNCTRFQSKSANRNRIGTLFIHFLNRWLQEHGQAIQQN